MKKLATLTAGVTSALSGISYGGGFDNANATLYYHLPFGGNSHETIPSVGFAVDYDVSAGTFGNVNPLRRSLVDFRFQKNQLQDMKLNGITLAVRDQETNELTIGGREIGTVTAVVVGGLVIGGVMCATENGICEDDDPKKKPSEGPAPR